jgi:hypothetical protein
MLDGYLSIILLIVDDLELSLALSDKGATKTHVNLQMFIWILFQKVYLIIQILKNDTSIPITLRIL